MAQITVIVGKGLWRGQKLNLKEGKTYMEIEKWAMKCGWAMFMDLFFMLVD